MAAEKLPLGAWEGDRTLIHRAAVGDRGDVADLPTDVQFRVYVARLVNRREQNVAAEFDQPAAFVLVSPEQYEAARLGRMEQRLIHTGSRRLTGRIHFVTVAATSSIVEEFGGDDQAMFKRLEAIGMANLPTLIYVPQKPVSSLSFYPKGSASDAGLTDVPLVAAHVSVEVIQRAIDAIHREELITPDGHFPYKIWKDPSKGLPYEHAEKGVQQLVRIGLAAKFAPCSIRQEQPAKVGRTDLEIVDDRTGPRGHSLHHAVLELKVLRSRGETGNAYSDGDTRQHITEGVQQAYAYGNDKNTQAQMLCCFDMRDDDEGDEKAFAHVSNAANEMNVHLTRWFLYRTSEIYRAALAAAVAASNP